MPNFNDFEDELLRRFPEWQGDFEIEFHTYEENEEIGNYIIVVDFIIPLLQSLASKHETEAVKKFFDFFEDVAKWDEASDTLIHIEIGEWLLEPDVDRSYFEQFGGPFVRFAVKTITDWREAHPSRTVPC